MRSNEHSDPTELYPTGLEAAEYIRASARFDGYDLVITDGMGDEYQRVTLGFTTATELSHWFRTVTRQVIRVAKTKGRKDHLVLRGGSLCSYSVRVSGNQKPFGVIHPSSRDGSLHQWYVPLEYVGEINYPRQVCSGCLSKARKLGLNIGGARYSPDQSPPECPECGEPASVFNNETYSGPQIEHGFGDDAAVCELSREQTIEHYHDVLNISPSDLPLVTNDDPYTYIADFPSIVEAETGGLVGYFGQPEISSQSRLSKRTAGYAAVFVLTHEEWDVAYTIPFTNWWGGDLFEYTTPKLR